MLWPPLCEYIWIFLPVRFILDQHQLLPSLSFYPALARRSAGNTLNWRSDTFDHPLQSLYRPRQVCWSPDTTMRFSFLDGLPAPLDDALQTCWFVSGTVCFSWLSVQTLQEQQHVYLVVAVYSWIPIVDFPCKNGIKKRVKIPWSILFFCFFSFPHSCAWWFMLGFCFSSEKPNHPIFFVSFFPSSRIFLDLDKCSWWLIRSVVAYFLRRSSKYLFHGNFAC